MPVSSLWLRACNLNLVDSYYTENPETTEIGDLKALNSNARVMVKMALFSAWARLQVASAEQEYLIAVVQPYLAKLTPLWLSSLEEFARLRFEPDISGSLGTAPAGADLDEVYAALNRETLLKVSMNGVLVIVVSITNDNFQFYQDSWLYLVDAISGLVERDIEFVFDALDGKTKASPTEEGTSNSKGPDQKPEEKERGMSYRDEPVAFFFVLFGLAFEALVDPSTLAHQKLAILQSLKKVLRPVVSGNAVYQDAIFSETMDSLDRLVLTEGLPIQNVIVGIARNLALDHPSAKNKNERGDHLSDDIEQLFELTRSIILVLAGLLPNLSDPTPHTRFNVSSEESLSLIRLSLDSLVDVSSTFPSIIRNDLHACILHIFTTILATGVCQSEVVPNALPIFRKFVSGVTNPHDTSPETFGNLHVVSRQLRGCLSRFLMTLTIAQRRESSTSVPCAKNTLLATTILLSAGSHVIPPQDPVIHKMLDELLDCLQDVGLANVAAGCIRSIVLAPGQRSPTGQVIAKYLFPRLIGFLISCPSVIGDTPSDPENSRALIARTLVAYVNGMSSNNASSDPQQVPLAMSIVMSALITRAKREGQTIYKETAGCILELAKADQATFLSLVANAKPDQKTLIEDVLRNSNIGSRGRGDGGLENTGVKSAPTIALRMDF